MIAGAPEQPMAQECNAPAIGQVPSDPDIPLPARQAITLRERGGMSPSARPHGGNWPTCKPSLGQQGPQTGTPPPSRLCLIVEIDRHGVASGRAPPSTRMLDWAHLGRSGLLSEGLSPCPVLLKESLAEAASPGAERFWHPVRSHARHDAASTLPTSHRLPAVQ
jgi:hypothetical protein